VSAEILLRDGNGELQAIIENSTFCKINDQWKYKESKVDYSSDISKQTMISEWNVSTESTSPKSHMDIATALRKGLKIPYRYQKNPYKFTQDEQEEAARKAKISKKFKAFLKRLPHLKLKRFRLQARIRRNSSKYGRDY
jgi:hypothetical protein